MVITQTKYHGPINHELATPFLSYIVTLNASQNARFHLLDKIVFVIYRSV